MKAHEIEITGIEAELLATKPLFLLLGPAKDFDNVERAIFCVQAGDDEVYVSRVKNDQVEFAETMPVNEARQVYENYIGAGFRRDPDPQFVLDHSEGFLEVVDYILYYGMWEESVPVSSSNPFDELELTLLPYHTFSSHASVSIFNEVFTPPSDSIASPLWSSYLSASGSTFNFSTSFPSTSFTARSLASEWLVSHETLRQDLD